MLAGHRSLDSAASELLVIGDLYLNSETNTDVLDALLSFDESFFKTTAGKAVWEPTRRYYLEYGKLPLTEVALNALFKDKELTLLQSAMEQVADCSDDTEFIKDEFKKRIISTKIKQLISSVDMLSLPSSNGIVDNVKIIKRLTQETAELEVLTSKLGESSNILSLKSGLDKANDYLLPEQGELIAVPIEGISNTSNYGGSFRGDMNLLIAPPGTGKTTILTSIAANYVKQFGNVLYVTLETPSTSIMFKIASLLTKGKLDSQMYLLHKRKGDSQLFDGHTSLLDKLKNQPYDVYFMDVSYGEPITAFSIGRYVRQLYQRKGVKIDIVIVDYADLLRSSQGEVGSLVDMGFSYQLLVADELRMMAQQERVVVWTATQSAKGLGAEMQELSKFRPLNLKDMWGSDGKVQFSSLVLGVAAYNVMGEAVGILSVLKDRHHIGDLGKYYKLNLNYSTAELKLTCVDRQSPLSGGGSSWPDLVKAWADEVIVSRDIAARATAKKFSMHVSESRDISAIQNAIQTSRGNRRSNTSVAGFDSSFS